ncbi:MAG: TRAP transporter small permease [Myxococcota bacterium]|jgi:TRAP-type C4-dicarboxylate transport system permease small subunit|nr:TRAP transporter small permease [Myxococcota bacterium]
MRVRGWLDRTLGALLAGLMGLAVANVVWQVVSRYLLDAPSSFTDELARFLLVWIGLLGAAYGVGQRLHLAIDLLPANLDRRWVRFVEIASAILVSGFALGVLTLGGGRLVELTASLGQTSPALGVPMALVYLVIPVAGLVITAYVLIDLATGREADPPQRPREAHARD